MLNVIIIWGIGMTTVVLNMITTNLVIKSSIHSVFEKQKMVLLIWILPIIGSLMSVSRLEKDAIKNREMNDKILIENLHKLTAKIDSVKEQVIQSRKEKQ